MCKDKTITVDRNSHTLVSDNACYLILKAKLYRERERERERVLKVIIFKCYEY